MFTFSTLQIASAIKEVVSKAGGDLTPHILCGDFNSEVTSPGYQLCTEGYLSDACIQQLQSLENLQFQDGTVSRIKYSVFVKGDNVFLIFEIWFLLNHWNFWLFIFLWVAFTHEFISLTNYETWYMVLFGTLYLSWEIMYFKHLKFCCGIIGIT